VIAAVHGREMEVHLPGLRGGRRPVERHLRGAGSATARARRRKLAGSGSSACTPRGPDRARERERVQTQVCADVDRDHPRLHLARDHAALSALEEARLPGERREPAIRVRRGEPLAIHAHGALADRQAVERGQQPLERACIAPIRRQVYVTLPIRPWPPPPRAALFRSSRSRRSSPEILSAAQNTAGNAGTECRATAGDCDVAEVCDGANAACPADAFQPSRRGVAQRPSP